VVDPASRQATASVAAVRPCGVHPSGFGVRDPAVQPSGVRSPGVVVQRVRRSAVCCPPVQRPVVCCPAVCCPRVRCPAVCCLPRPSRTRPSSSTSGGGVGDQVAVAGDPDHRNGWRPRWLPGRRRLDDGPGGRDAGRRCRSRVDQREVGGDPGRRVGAGRGGAGGGAVGTGAGGSARWPHAAWLPSSGLGARPRWVVVAEPDARVGGPGGARGGAGGDGRAAPARPKPAASAPSSLPAAL